MSRLPVPEPTPSPEMQAFAENIRAERLTLKLSQRAFSEKAGVTQAYMVKVEKARTNLSLNMASKLASVVGKPLWKLIRKRSSSSI